MGWFPLHSIDCAEISEFHIKLDQNFIGNITTGLQRVLYEEIMVDNPQQVGICRRNSRNVTATDAQLVALHSQHVPHGKASTLDLLCETSGAVVWDKGVRGICGGAGWVRMGPRGWLWLTVYLERSDSILRRKANKLSAPLEQEAGAREKQPRVRSMDTHILHHIQCYSKWENFAERRKRNFIMLEQYLWVLLGHSSRGAVM